MSLTDIKMLETEVVMPLEEPFVDFAGKNILVDRKTK
jgi:hypothetical protein